MNGSRLAVTLLAVFLSIAVAGSGAGFLASPGGVASGGHGEEDADYTVEPQDPADREPGASNTQYGQIVVAQAGVDFETLERLEAVYDEGSWTNCGQGDADEFGIDRGNTNDGYETDESLEENVKRFSAGEDVFEVEFNGEDDIGASTHLNDGDAIVSLATCIDNPDEPGWYQISGSSTGTTEDGEEVTISGESHYFWICECSSEEEAREELGPPPSEDGENGGGDGEDEEGTSGDEEESGTPEAEGDTPDEESSDGESETSSEGSDEEGESEFESESTGADATTNDETADDAEQMTDEADDGSADESSEEDAAVEADEAASNGSDDWDDHRVETPASGDGPGFGPVAGVVAMLGTGLLLLGRV